MMADVRLFLDLVLFFSLLIFSEQELMHGDHHRYLHRNGVLLRNARLFRNDLSRYVGQNDECGIVRSGGSRVVSGDNATVGEWPWQAQLNLIQPSGDLRFFCGGSLIDNEWVVTAGHCIVDNDHSKYVVIVGGIDRRNIEVSEQIFGVKRIIRHQLYNTGAPYTNDIALLQLSRKALVTPFVNTVCLPRQGEKVGAGTNCFISGWGQMLHPGDSAEFLQQAAMPVVTNHACAAKLDSSLNGGLRIDNRTWHVTDQMLCAGDAGKTKTNGCYGDSGGPFVCKDMETNRWVLQGVVSWGDPDCSSSNHYSVFTRVSSFVGWIRRQTDRFTV